MYGLKKQLLILGTGPSAVGLCRIIMSDLRLVKVVGFLDRSNERVGERLVNPGIIGTYDQLAQLVEKHHVDTIVVCLEDRRCVLPVQALLDCKVMGLDVLDGNHLFEEAAGRISVDSLHPSALIFSEGFRRRLISRVSKRLLDPSFHPRRRSHSSRHTGPYILSPNASRAPRAAVSDVEVSVDASGCGKAWTSMC
jgi:hypothetical protein